MRREMGWAAACICGAVAGVFGLCAEPGITATTPSTSPPSLVRPKRQRDAFWQEARVPEPGHFREPSALVSKAIATSSADLRAKTEELLSKGDTNGVTLALVDWFSSDPAGARDWLATKESFSFCQPALKMVAVSFATRGDCDLALEWTALLESPQERDEAVARIYSTGFTSGHFSSEDLAAAPLTDESRRAILNGKAND